MSASFSVNAHFAGHQLQICLALCHSKLTASFLYDYMTSLKMVHLPLWSSGCILSPQPSLRSQFCQTQTAKLFWCSSCSCPSTGCFSSHYLHLGDGCSSLFRQTVRYRILAHYHTLILLGEQLSYCHQYILVSCTGRQILDKASVYSSPTYCIDIWGSHMKVILKVLRYG